MLSDVVYRLRAIFGQEEMDEDLNEELTQHLERQTATYEAAGIPREQAERRARLEFGGLEQVKEETRDVRGVSFLDTLQRDLRYGLRVLWKSPAFSLTAVLSLALGIGANIAIFQLLDVIRLRLLPVEAPRQLVAVRVTDMSLARGSSNGDGVLTYAQWEEVRIRQNVFSGLAAWAGAGFNLSPTGEVRMVPGLWVSGDFFHVLGVTPVLGRVFSLSDDVKGCGTSSAVISYSFWQSEFGGDPAALGRTVRLNGHAVPVIGVTRPGFTGLEAGRQFQIAVPICSVSTLWFDAESAGTFWWLNVISRLKTGVAGKQAAAQMNAISPAVFSSSLPPDYPPVSAKDYLAMRLTALPASSGFSGLRDFYSQPLEMLLAIAGLVLLIACANLANLMLARASARDREIAVRLAMGASRGRIIRQLMAESFLIAAAGSSFAFVVSRVLSRALVVLLRNGDDSVFFDLHLDWRVLAFTAGLAVITCLLFGLAPALRATASASGPVLKGASRGLTASRERFGLRRLLVASQVAFSLLLLVGALLFVQSLQNLMHAQTGFRPDHILIVDLTFASSTPNAVPDHQKRMLDRIRAMPGVTSAARTTIVPLGGGVWDNRVWPDGKDIQHATDTRLARVGPDYFKTLQTPILTGRDFNEDDGSSAPRVAVINQAFAVRVMSDPSPIGRMLHIEATPSHPESTYRIVGMTANAKYRNLRETFEPIVYLSIAQDVDPSTNDELLIRSSLPLSTLLPALRRVIGEANPSANFSFLEMKTMIAERLLPERLIAALSSAFGILAGLLSAMGIYGVVSYLVARRRNEIGIRMALGADRRKILAMVLRESAQVLGLGLAAGTILSLSIGAFAGSMFFEL